MLVSGVGKILRCFARSVRRPSRSLETTDAEKILTQKDQKDYEEAFAPLTQQAQEEAPPSNRLVKEIQKELVYIGEDKHPNKLVNRIQKNSVWGLGGQLLDFSRRINRQGVQGNVESIKEFLLSQQTKDIYVHDFGPVMPHINQWAIIASAYSNRHCHKVGSELKNALNEGRKSGEYPAKMMGRKDDESVLVEFKDITVHLMTEQERLEADLQWKWNNPVSEEVVEKYQRMANHKSRGYFEPFDD